MSFTNEADVKAVRKRHRCEGCRRHIEVGEPAKRWTGVVDGDFGTAVFHPDCREAEVALNKLAGTDWDEWMGLDDMEPEDRQWLCEEYPAVAARFGWSIYDWREPRVAYCGGFYWMNPN